jgi:hypothetical protein
VLELGYLAVTLPKLNVVPVDKLRCPFHGCFVVGAFDCVRVEKVAVGSDDVNAIVRHVAAPLARWELAELSVTDSYRRPGGDIRYVVMDI